MKEYMVQMKLRSGNWYRGRRPNGSPVRRTQKSIEEAQEFMDSCIKAWSVYIEKCDGNGIGLVEEHLPAEWRIMSREVSEWRAE